MAKRKAETEAIVDSKKLKTTQPNRQKEAKVNPKKPKANKETKEVINAKKRKTEEDFQSRLSSQQKRWRRQPWRQYYHAVTADDETRNGHLSPILSTAGRTSGASHFGSLPLDIVFVVSTFLNISDLASLVYTCRSLRHYLTPQMHRRAKTTDEFKSAIRRRSNKEDLIKLLDAGADPSRVIRLCANRCNVRCYVSPLHLAIYPSLETDNTSIQPPDIQLVKLLLKYGANPNTRSHRGATALAWAVEEQSRDAVMHLLDAGADPDVLFEDGFPVLSRAIRTSDGMIGEPGIVELLLDHGADPNILDKYGQTPLCIAVEESLRHVVVGLLNAGANPDVLTQSGISLLCMAVSVGGTFRDGAEDDQMGVVSLLLQSGCDPNLVDRDGYTALHRAVRSKHNRHSDLLLQHGADPNIATGQMRWTPLHFATNAHDLPSCDSLCNNGADPNKGDAAGSTPLHIAFRGRYKVIRDLLLDHGADPHAEDCLNLKPSSYHFNRNIHAWNSIVGGDVDRFVMGRMDNSVVDGYVEINSDVEIVRIKERYLEDVDTSILLG